MVVVGEEGRRDCLGDGEILRTESAVRYVSGNAIENRWIYIYILARFYLDLCREWVAFSHS